MLKTAHDHVVEEIADHVAALPIRSLDRLSLQAKIKDIGRLEGATAKETT